MYKKSRDVKRKGKDAVFYVSLQRNGVHCQVCTGTSNRDEARLIEAQLLDGLRGEVAERVAESVRRILGGGNKDVVCKVADLADTIERLLEHEKSTLEHRSVVRRINILARFSEWAAKQKIIRVSDVSVQAAWSYVESLSGKAKSKQNIVGQLSVSWNMLRRAGLAKENPWRDVRPRSNRAEQKSGTAFTIEELARILDESRRIVIYDDGKVDRVLRLDEPRNTWLTSSIMLAARTGLRQCDCFRLTWGELDLAEGRFSTTPSKTKRYNIAINAPLPDDLLCYLRSLNRRGDNDTIIIGVPSHPEHAWNLCVKRAGITRGSKELMTFHSLRHTYATLLSETGADQKTLMKLGAWTNTQTVMRYDHSTAPLKEAVGKLPSLFPDIEKQ